MYGEENKMSDKIIAEVEDTSRGTIQVVQHSDNTYSVGLLNEKEKFEVKHPNVDAAGAIRAMSFYFQGELNMLKKG